MKAKVLLVTGPAGSGKSTLAKHVTDKLGWQYVCEDDYWVKNGWSHGIRTDEQEADVQQQVFADVIELIEQGKGVVLEFILYKNPPNPLTAYLDRMESDGVNYKVVALKPTVDEIMRRIKTRGREDDLNDLENRRTFAEHQLKCLEQDYIAEWVVDADVSLERLTVKIITLLNV